MRDLLVTLASIRRLPLWTHFYVFCFVFFFSLSFNFEFISFYCFNLLFLQFVLAFVWSLYVFPKWTWPVPGGQLEKRSAVVKNAIFAAELKKKKKKKNVLFMRRLDPGFFLFFGPLQLSNCLMQTVVLRLLSST